MTTEAHEARVTALRRCADKRRKVEKSAVALLHSQGVGDPDIARMFGVSLQAVRAVRQALGLPRHECRKWPQESRDQRRAMLLEERERWGKLAASYGLPADLHLTQLRILVLLTSGPKDSAELDRIIGVRVSRSRMWKLADRCLAGRTYLQDLLRRGLVFNYRQPQVGRCSKPYVYSLTAEAMAMMSRPATS